MENIEKLLYFLNQNPQDCFLQHALALEYIKAGNENEAQKVFERLLQANPEYVGSYYHLGKLHERKREGPQAMNIYKKGMEMAISLADRHSYNELKSAWETLSEM